MPLVGAHRLEARHHPHPLLGGAGAGEVGVVLVLLHLLDERRRVADGRVRAQPVGPVDQHRRLVGGRHLERVDVVRRDPGDVVVDGLGGDLHRGGRHAGGHLGDRDRGLGDPARLLGGEHDAGGEAPRAPVDDPDREPEVLGVHGGLQHPVAGGEVLVADPLEAEVGVGRPELAGPAQRDLAEVSEGQGREGRVEAVSTHGSEPSGAVRVLRMTTPAWLGIGAQRSGTTWFTDLLTQHPEVGLGTNGKKEQHLLHKVGDGAGAGVGLPRPVPGRRRASGGVDAAVPAARHRPGHRGPAARARTSRCSCCCATRWSGSCRRCGSRPPGRRPRGPTRCRSRCRASAASTPTSSPCGRTTSGASGWW